MKPNLEIFKGFKKKSLSEEEKAVQAQIEKIGQEAKLMKDLVNHKGWKLLDEFFKKKQELLSYELKICSPEQLVRLQEKAKIIDEFYAFINSKIIRGQNIDN